MNRQAFSKTWSKAKKALVCGSAISLCIAFTIHTAAQAQTAPDLNGSWVRPDGVQYVIRESNGQISVQRAADFVLNGVSFPASTVIEQASCTGLSCTGQALTVANDGSGRQYQNPLNVQISSDGNSTTFTFGGDSTTPPYTLTRQ